MRREWNILHLTDLHFGQLSNLNESLFLDDNKEAVAAEFRESIIKRFCHLLEHGRIALKADAIVVTGDITTAGAEDGFTFFSEKIVPYLMQLVDSPAAICIVPGNHDVVWNLSRSDAKLFDKKFEKFGEMVRKVGATSCLLPTGTVDNSTQSDLEFLELDRDDTTPIYIDPAKKLLVLCINSAIRCGEVNEKRRSQIEAPLNKMLRNVEEVQDSVRYANPDAKTKLEHMKVDLNDLKEMAAFQTVFDVAHVTEPQLLRLSSKLEYLQQKYSAEWDSFLRVAIMHHHLMPFSRQATEHKPYDLITDAANVRDFLGDFRFHVMLTGHKHQPYAQVHARRENRLLVAGGPTVGGAPVTGYDHGFRHMKVVNDDGGMTAKIAEIRLNQALVTQPVTHLVKQISDAESYMLDDSRPKLCRVLGPPSIRYDATEDLSDESLMFINVVSCRQARAEVYSYLLELIRKGEIEPLKYVGLYDLYGHYDLLVRIDDPSLKGDKGIKLLSRIEQHLENTKMKHRQHANVTTINLLEAQPFDGQTGTHSHNLFPTQAVYTQLRSHRAFILVTKTDNWSRREIDSVKGMARKFYAENREIITDPTDWSLSWGQRDIVIEVLVRCGQYYYLQDLTRRLEELVDLDDRQKMTHIVYHHEEYCPLGNEIIGQRLAENHVVDLDVAGLLG